MSEGPYRRAATPVYHRERGSRRWLHLTSFHSLLTLLAGLAGAALCVLATGRRGAFAGSCCIFCPESASSSSTEASDSLVGGLSLRPFPLRGVLG